MNYELAKQLKDAGFPQKYPTGMHNAKGQRYWMHDPSDDDYIEIVHNGLGDNALDDSQLTLIPTLSELIEACGKMSLFSYEGQEVWQAEGGPIYVNIETMQGGYKTGVVGSTPSEAVANLYLELKRQKRI